MTELPGKRVGLLTVGCKLNQYETEGLAELLESSGYEVVPFEERADVYVVNTCTVTGRSDYRSRQMLRRAARTNPDALVVAAGCYAQRDPGALGAMPQVGLVVGQSSKSELPDLIEAALAERGTDAEIRGKRESGAPQGAAHATPALVDVRPHAEGRFQSFDIDRFRGYTRAFLKIQDGCDRSCSYCAVPGARGPSVSRPLAEVVEHAARLASSGYREIVLTGVHIGAYGEGGDGPRLADLLRALAEIEDLERIRLGSVEPRELTPELLSVFADVRKTAHHLHVPMQSGSDDVLRAMKRGYTRDDYANAVRAASAIDPLFGIGADVIVGFPGETEEDFADTVSLVTELSITYLHVFSFSPRPGTAAAEMDDDLPGVEKRRRSKALRELGRRKSLAFRRGLAGTALEVLLEERSGDEGRPSGLTGNYVRVEVENAEPFRNRIVGVVIDGADEEGTWGHLAAAGPDGEPASAAPGAAPADEARRR